MKSFKQYISNTILVVACMSAMLGAAAPALAAAQALPPQVMSADSVSDACAGVGLAGGDCSKGGTATNGVGNVIKTIVNLLSAIVGAVAIIMIIISGLKFVTSGGDSNAVSAAKSGIIYAIVGLIVVALAQTLVHFVIKSVA